MRRLRRLLRVLFAWDHGPSVELVVYANLFVGVAIGATGLFALPLSITASLLLAIATFLALTLALLNRFTIWVSIVLGALVMSLASAALCASVGSKLLGEAGGWIGGALGVALGIWLSLSAYADVFRSLSGQDE